MNQHKFLVIFMLKYHLKFWFSQFFSIWNWCKGWSVWCISFIAGTEGKLSLTICLPNNWTKICSHQNVLYIPKVACNSLSLFRVTSSGKVTKFHENSCKIFSQNNELVDVGKRVGKLYTLAYISNFSPIACYINSSEN